jgi:integrase/recombinase XerD
VTSAAASPRPRAIAHLSQLSPAMGPESLADAVALWLGDLVRAERSPATARAYRCDLSTLLAVYDGPVDGVTVEHLRQALVACAKLSASTRNRRQAAMASFFKWSIRQGLCDANPTDRLEPVRVNPPLPRALRPGQIQAILAAIPASHLRDRVIFNLLYCTGARVGEVLALHAEDVDLTVGDERITVLGKGNKRRTLLIDDPRVLVLLRRHLRGLRRTSGPVFTSSRGTSTTPLAYETIRQRWQTYCAIAGVEGNIHQLRHSHATELIDGGVRIETIRKRLGHASFASTARYAQLSDRVADAELRAWRRARG